MKTLKKCDATRKISEAGLDIVNAQHKEVEFLRPFRCWKCFSRVGLPNSWLAYKAHI